MRTINSIANLRSAVKKEKLKKKIIGFVPTMGALHDGHLSLLARCRKECDIVILSIFVNPKQFGPKEDFGRYPREIKRDEKLAKRFNVDIIFYPSAKIIYPTDYLTYIETEVLGSVLCGKTRPGHFKGVTTVVGKLINIVGPDVMYLGQKDAQQAVIISKMVQDLNFPVTVRVCPTIREKDGLALSSRNIYLSGRQRREAPVLYQSLREAKRKIRAGEHKSSKIILGIRNRITRSTRGKIDFIACVNASSLESLTRIKGKVLIALAVKFGSTRLIDNVAVNV